MSSYSAAVAHLYVAKQQALGAWARFNSTYGAPAPQRLTPRQRRRLARRRGRGLRALRISPFGYERGAAP